MEPIYKRKVWGGARGWCTKVVRISFGVGVWKAKRRDWEVVAIRVNLEVGNGARVLFWKDKWCGPMPLCVAFPSLLAIVALVKDVWSPDEGVGKWNPLFLRPFNDWELKEVNKFLLCLRRKIVQPNVEDKVIWGEEKNGQFSVKSLFKELDTATHFPANMIWQSMMQPRICFFALEAAWGRA